MLIRSSPNLMKSYWFQLFNSLLNAYIWSNQVDYELINNVESRWNVWRWWVDIDRFSEIDHNNSSRLLLSRDRESSNFSELKLLATDLYLICHYDLYWLQDRISKVEYAKLNCWSAWKKIKTVWILTDFFFLNSFIWEHACLTSKIALSLIAQYLFEADTLAAWDVVP